MAEIADAAFEYQQKLEKGEKKIVGVNTLTDTVTGELEILRVSHEVEVEQCRVLAERKAHRDDEAGSDVRYGVLVEASWTDAT